MQHRYAENGYHLPNKSTLPCFRLLATTALILACASCAAPGTVRPGQRIVEPDMVLIPGGEFTMGHTEGGDHTPAHKVMLDPFYLDKFEVTNAQYLEYVEATGARLPEYWEMERYSSGEDFPNHPVVGIASAEANAYAEWAGKRLPTEAEWECAARGGLIGKKYPHGDELTPKDANYWRWDILAPSGGGIVEVGRYPANGYGLHDMAGNVVEWVSDRYAEDYYAYSPTENPRGPERGRFRVIRGGGWHSGPSCNRVYYRNALPPNWRDPNVGFRCARDAG